MKTQLAQYVDLLFAGARGCEDIRQEILQNTLDRYDDLIAEGKTPEAAYRLAIMGIGDISEILGAPHAAPAHAPAPKADGDTPVKKVLRVIAVALYILCIIPLVILGSIPGLETIGLCGMLAIVAVATVLMMLGAKKETPPAPEHTAVSPRSELRKSIGALIWTVGIAVYFIVSFLTNAWFITWIIFPLTGAVKGLIQAILDFMEANKNEN